MQRGCGVAGAMAAAFVRLLLPFSTLLFALSYCCLHNVEHLADRKALFLLCIAILLFVAMDSGLRRFQKEQPALKSSESFDRGSSSAPHPQGPRTEEKGSWAKRGDEVAAEGVGSPDLAAGKAMSLENAANGEGSGDAEDDELPLTFEELYQEFEALHQQNEKLHQELEDLLKRVKKALRRATVFKKRY